MRRHVAADRLVLPPGCSHGGILRGWQTDRRGRQTRPTIRVGVPWPEGSDVPQAVSSRWPAGSERPREARGSEARGPRVSQSADRPRRPLPRWAKRIQRPSDAPAPPGSNRCSGSTELPCHGPLVHPELAGHECERRALFVPCRGERNRVGGHLADHAPSSKAGPIEVGDDGGPVDLVATGERIDGRTLALPVNLWRLFSGTPLTQRLSR